MNKYIVFLLTLAFVFVASPLQAAAIKATAQGIVTDNGSPLSGLTVSVTCAGTTLTDDTDATGFYKVNFENATCNPSTSAVATVTYNGETQTLSDDIDPSSKIATINFAFGAAAVPEFGIVTGLMAAGGSGLLFYKMRRNRA